MFIVTFYSYKGGVGRTLSLVNTAYRLASRGKRVFILDFDLEAPGLDVFFRPIVGEGKPGVVEYISKFTEGGDVEPLNGYVHEIELIGERTGKMYFMSAGKKDRRYQHLLSKLDWKYFYGRNRGFMFVENFKATIEKDYSPDYVLIDSRTGLTDISGICTLQLPNLVVLLFNLNNQNIAGISQIYKSIRFNQLQREIKLLLVASPIPDVPDYIGIRKDRLDYAGKAIGSDTIDVILPFDPFVAFEEKVVSEKEPKTYLARSYDLLCEKIVLSNRGDPLTILEDAHRQEHEGNIDIANLRYQDLIEANSADPTVYREYGRFLRARGLYEEAAEHFKRAYELDPQSSEALGQLISCLLEVRRVEEATTKLDEFLRISSMAEQVSHIADEFQNKGELQAALRGYNRAIALSESPGAHLECGNVYMRMQKPSDALVHYKRSIEMGPPRLAYVYNYAYALNLLGNPDAIGYFKQAVELFEQTDMSSLSSIDRPNYYQAISHAYKAVGEFEKARQMLTKALEAAKKLGQRHRVFSSLQYKRITNADFLEETAHLLKAL